MSTRKAKRKRAAAPVAAVVVEDAQRAASSQPTIVLASNCNVKDAGELKQSLCHYLDDGAPVALDIGKVERVDTSTIQLLCAFVRDRTPLFLAMATHGRRGLDRLRLGSVTEAVLRQVDVPLLISRPDTAGARGQAIVVALDGSPLAEEILPDAVRLAKATGRGVSMGSGPRSGQSSSRPLG